MERTGPPFWHFSWSRFWGLFWTPLGLQWGPLRDSPGALLGCMGSPVGPLVGASRVSFGLLYGEFLKQLSVGLAGLLEGLSRGFASLLEDPFAAPRRCFEACFRGVCLVLIFGKVIHSVCACVCTCRKAVGCHLGIQCQSVVINVFIRRQPTHA